MKGHTCHGSGASSVPQGASRDPQEESDGVHTQPGAVHGFLDGYTRWQYGGKDKEKLDGKTPQTEVHSTKITKVKEYGLNISKTIMKVKYARDWKQEGEQESTTVEECRVTIAEREALHRRVDSRWFGRCMRKFLSWWSLAEKGEMNHRWEGDPDDRPNTDNL